MKKVFFSSLTAYFIRPQQLRPLVCGPNKPSILLSCCPPKLNDQIWKWPMYGNMHNHSVMSNWNESVLHLIRSWRASDFQSVDKPKHKQPLHNRPRRCWQWALPRRAMPTTDGSLKAAQPTGWRHSHSLISAFQSHSACGRWNYHPSSFPFIFFFPLHGHRLWLQIPYKYLVLILSLNHQCAL